MVKFYKMKIVIKRVVGWILALNVLPIMSMAVGGGSAQYVFFGYDVWLTPYLFGLVLSLLIALIFGVVVLAMILISSKK